MSPSQTQRVCQACGAPMTFDEPIPRDAECASCGHDLRCCHNCRHWDTHYNNECRETEAEPVADKARRNFCEFFDYTRAIPASHQSPRASKEELRAKFESMLGGAAKAKSELAARTEPVEKLEDQVSKRIDDLFKKKPGE